MRAMINHMILKRVHHLSSDWLASITDGSRLALGNYCSDFSCNYYVVLIGSNNLGYELKSVGFNQHASQYAGMKVSRNVVFSMTIAGAFAGIGGAMEGLRYIPKHDSDVFVYRNWI